MKTGKLAKLFAALIELNYSEFRAMELSNDISNEGDLILRLARATRHKRGGLRAIKEVLDRMDGKIAVEVEFIQPKFYMLFPHAKSKEGGDEPAPLPSGDTADTSEVALPSKDEDPPTGSLRAVVDKMLDRKKSERLAIIKAADEIDEFGSSPLGDPKLKSVIAAGLYDLMDYNLGAIYELFDQIDGKVAEVYKELGDDVYIQNYSLIAPAHAKKNEDGVYYVEAINTSNAWGLRLEQQRNARKKR